MPNWILNLGCKIGWHHGDWVYLDAGECNQTRICRDCGEEDSRVEHDVEKWDSDGFLSQGQSGVCSRCEQQLTRYKTKDERLD